MVFAAALFALLCVFVDAVCVFVFATVCFFAAVCFFTAVRLLLLCVFAAVRLLLLLCFCICVLVLLLCVFVVAVCVFVRLCLCCCCVFLLLCFFCCCVCVFANVCVFHVVLSFAVACVYICALQLQPCEEIFIRHQFEVVNDINFNLHFPSTIRATIDQ